MFVSLLGNAADVIRLRFSFGAGDGILTVAMLPEYLAKASPNPASNRAPWYVNTAPSYAGIFLWIAFYNSMAGGTITRASLGVCLLALAVALTCLVEQGVLGCNRRLACQSVEPRDVDVLRCLPGNQKAAVRG